MVNKNVIMNQKFNELTIDEKMNVLGINDTIVTNSKYKYCTKETIVSDLWNGKTNSQKRKLMKAFAI